MSLDLSLYRRQPVTDDDDQPLYTKNEQGEYVPKMHNEEAFWQNITHNLGTMASHVKAGRWNLYQLLWRPEEHGFHHLTPEYVRAVGEGYRELAAHEAKYSQYNAENGWGLYEHFCPWVGRYADFIAALPESELTEYEIYASR